MDPVSTFTLPLFNDTIIEESTTNGDDLIVTVRYPLGYKYYMWNNPPVNMSLTPTVDNFIRMSTPQVSPLVPQAYSPLAVNRSLSPVIPQVSSLGSPLMVQSYSPLPVSRSLSPVYQSPIIQQPVLSSPNISRTLSPISTPTISPIRTPSIRQISPPQIQASSGVSECLSHSLFLEFDTLIDSAKLLEYDWATYLSKFGSVVNVEIKSRGGKSLIIITFRTKEDVDNAYNQLNSTAGVSFLDSSITVFK